MLARKKQWLPEGECGINGAFRPLEDAADSILSMAVDQESPGFYCSAEGNVFDEFISSLAVELVEGGDTFVIDGKVYIRTEKALIPQLG